MHWRPSIRISFQEMPSLHMTADAKVLAGDPPPQTSLWLPFKVSSQERLAQMREGLLYMNSLHYFATLPGEEHLALRRDELESVYGIWRAGPREQGLARLTISIGDCRQEIDLGSNATLKVEFPQPKNTMLFCMSAFADGPDGRLPGQVDDKVYLDERFLQFGSHILLITAPTEFSKRINAALSRANGIFGSRLFHGGYGLVSYKPLENYSGPIGLYTKDSKYDWQREFRIAFGAEAHLLNTVGAYEFNIGDISDISQIVGVQALIDEPLTIRRQCYRKVGNNYELLRDE